MGFFKKIKKQVKRSFKKVKAQIKRKPTFESAQKQGIRSTAKVSREAQRAISRSGLPPEVIDAILLGLGPVGQVISTALEAGQKAETIEAQQKRLIRATKAFQAAELRGPSMGFFSSLGGSLLDLGKGLLTDVVAPVASQVLVSQVSQLTQRALGVKQPRRAAPAAFPAQQAFVPSGLGLRLPSPVNLLPQFPATGFGPPTSATFPGVGPFPRGVAVSNGAPIPGARVEVPRFPRSPAEAPEGSQRLQPVLLPDGTVGFIPIRKRRRMNVLNPRALNRAVRRVDGFTKFVKRSRKALRKCGKL